jgi:hypothetical protein
MSTAEAIMKKKRFIKKEMDRQISLEMSDRIWKRSTEKLEQILRKYADIPAGVRSHTDLFIFPSAAIYLTAQEYIGKEQAYAIIENVPSKGRKALVKSSLS